MAGASRRSPTGRLEAFSDGVLAIVLTLLVLDLLPGDRAVPLRELLGAWPSYLAFLTAFLTVGSIWLSHHNAFGRIARVDPPALALNLLLLLGASLVPWPTALISAALRDGTQEERFTAIAVYSIVTLLIAVPWTLLGRHLLRHPELLADPGDVAWMRRHTRSSAGSIVVAVVATALATVSPIASLVLYLAVPAGFVVLALLDREPA